MTNKEELEKEYSDWVVKHHEDFGSFPTTSECGHYWLSKIQQIRKSDMERVDTIELIIKDIKSYSPDGEIGTLCNQALSIIKQPKGSFAVWTPEIKEHANQVKEIIENREKHETVS